MVRIPDEYQEVEYLESTGTQYIITNYHPQTDWTAVDWTFAFTASQNGDQMLWGARSAKNNRKIWQCEKYSGRSWYVACGSVSYRAVLADYGRKLNQIYTGHVDNTTFTVGGGSASPNQTNTGENESAIGIFCWNKNGTAEFKNSGLRIYSLTFKENDIVSANFIPCYRKSDNEAGMYDTVSGTFYTNSGTDAFLVGNPVEYSTINLLELRRLALLYDSHWNYFFKAEEDGRIPKAKIPLKSGQRVYVEWDTSRLASSNQTVFSFYKQVSSMNDVCKGWSNGGYPICWETGDIGNDIFRVGHAMLIMPKDLTMFIGYWQDSDTTDRRIYADYLKIKIL